ncbi:MAG: hypothetical protein KC492_44405 [Myxococcales bacterium]|nr:hypothetical protein [Myxococcales bacterium]
MSMPALPSSNDPRFQEMLARALSLPHDELAKRATECALDLEVCKTEWKDAQDWVTCNRAKLGTKSMLFISAATSQAVAAAYTFLPHGWALGLSVAQAVVSGGIALFGPKKRPGVRNAALATALATIGGFGALEGTAWQGGLRDQKSAQ